jgi:hypothetical protein
MNKKSPLSVSISQTMVVDLDVHKKCLTLSNGEIVSFDKCLVAVGATTPNLNHSKHIEDTVVPRCSSTQCSLSSSSALFSAVSSGAHVTVVGASSWDSLACATALARHRRPGDPRAPVTLVFPSFGPLSASVPRYLSQAIGKRLSQSGVALCPYSQVRYIGGGDSHRHSQSGQGMAVAVFLAKTYDSLSTSSFYTDHVLFSPNCVPLSKPHSLLRSDDNISPHSFIVNSDLEVDPISGGIVVNRSLEAVGGVFAAGDIANVFTSPSSDLVYRGVHSGIRHAILTGRGSFAII